MQFPPPLRGRAGRGSRSQNTEVRSRKRVRSRLLVSDFWSSPHPYPPPQGGREQSLLPQEPDLRLAVAALVDEREAVGRLEGILRLGFDDVITLPEKREVIVDRLVGQLNSEHLYIQTDSYLGPDRRRMEFPGAPTDSRRMPDSPHVRLHIRRSVERGVQIVRQEIRGRRVLPGGNVAHQPQIVRSDG